MASAESALTAQRSPSLFKPKLTQASEFKAVLVSDCRLSGSNFILRAIANELSNPRLGLIAGRKAARRAVDRNRGKRLARAAFFAARIRLPAVDVVLQLKNDLRKSGNVELRNELDRLLRDVAARFAGFKSPNFKDQAPGANL